MQDLREEADKLNEKQLENFKEQLEVYDLKQVNRFSDHSAEFDKKLETADHRSTMLFEDQKAFLVRRF